MALNDLINVRGKMDDAFKRLDPETIQGSDEVTRFILDPASDPFLCSCDHFWSSDIAVFTPDQDKAVYLARRSLNPIMREENIDQAVKQISEQGTYRMGTKDMKAIYSAVQKGTGDAVMVDVSHLQISEADRESLLTVFWPAHYNEMNKEQKLLFKFIYGSGDALRHNRDMISKRGVNKVQVWLLNPEYVPAREMIPKGEGIAMPLLISAISHERVFGGNYQSIDASHPDWNLINNNTYYMRGMPRYAEVVRQVAECIEQGKPFNYRGHAFVPVPPKEQILSAKA